MKFLVIGLGSMGKRRIRCIYALRAGEVVGYDIRADRRQEVERLYAVATVDCLEDGMATEPDAIVICTPPDQHVAYSLAALEAGKPFFVEDTVMLDPAALAPLLGALEGSHVVAAPSCTMRFHPAVKRMRQALERGEIGRVRSFHALCVSYLPDWHPWERVQDYYVGSRVSGGGREMVTFELDWLEWLFGPVNSVSAEVGKLSDIPANIDDTFQLLCGFAGGIRGTLTISVAYRVPGRVVEIGGSDGQIVWDSRSLRVAIYTASDSKWQHIMETASRDYSYDRMYVEEFEHFLRAARGEARFTRDFRDVQRKLEFLNTVERSAVEGRRIDFPLGPQH